MVVGGVLVATGVGAPIGGGILIGVGTSAVSQVALTGEIEARQMLTDTVIGGFTGYAGAATARFSLARQVATGVGVDVSVSSVSQLVNTGTIDPRYLAMDALVTSGISVAGARLQQNSVAADVMGAVDRMDVTAVRCSAVFYSGSGRREVAEEFAHLNGLTTMELTPCGRWLDEQHLFQQGAFFRPGSPVRTPQAAEIWARASERYAQSASGVAGSGNPPSTRC